LQIGQQGQQGVTDGQRATTQTDRKLRRAKHCVLLHIKVSRDFAALSENVDDGTVP